jgi:hypothetical protein
MPAVGQKLSSPTDIQTSYLLLVRNTSLELPSIAHGAFYDLQTLCGPETDRER